MLDSEGPTGSQGPDKAPPVASSSKSLPTHSGSKKLPTESQSSSSSSIKKPRPKESVKLDDMFGDNSFHALFGTPIKKTNAPTSSSKPPGPKSLTEKKMKTPDTGGSSTGDKHVASSTSSSSLEKQVVIDFQTQTLGMISLSFSYQQD